MGLTSTKPFLEMLEEAVPPTPPPPQKKFLDLDPRSPTTEIARTPIQVDKTPDSLLDPRSPTAGIPRTPIHSLAMDMQDATPVAPVHYSVEDSVDSTTSVQTSDDLLVTGQAESSENSCQAGQTEESVSFLSKPPRTRRRQKKLLLPEVIYTPPYDTNKQGGCRSPLTTLSKTSRSPLQAKDNTHVDSPRAIVQWKQMNKLSGKLLASSTGNSGRASPNTQQYKLFTDDKENMS